MHRNSQRRVYGDQIYLITSRVEGEYKFFKHQILCDVWIQELRLTKDVSHMKLFAFCLNYDHFHLLIKPDITEANYSKIMQFLKRHSSRNINVIFGYNKRSNEGDIGQYRLQNKTNNAHHRLRNELNKFDEYVLKLRESFKQIYGKNHDIPKFKWQKSFFDHMIRNKKDLEKHFNYTIYNFLKHELPEKWKYTGLNFKPLLDDFIG